MNFPWSKTPSIETTATIAPPLPNIPRPALVVAPMEDNEIKAYRTIADAIGFEPAELLHARLLAFLHGLNIDIFPYEAVIKYMTHRVRQENPTFLWWWCPLRPVDVITKWGWGYWDRDDFYRSSQWVCRPYHRAVPLRVLSRVQQIEAAFGNAVKFFVTNYGRADQPGDGSERPDPFIAAVALDMPRVIFDVWDEPEFGVK